MQSNTINLLTPEDTTPWGPTGKTVYERTYRRSRKDGSRETWPETVDRVVTGNLSLVYGDPDTWSQPIKDEHKEVSALMRDMKILPAGRHLWASGVPGRQYLFNCHVSGWGEKLSDHFSFSFLRLMEGGGVGANYADKNLQKYGSVRRSLRVHIVCDPAHPDYAKMVEAGLLSAWYSHEWTGAFPVEDSREGWSSALVDLIDTFMTDAEVKHHDRVYDVSRVRAEGQPLRTFGGTASGPAPLGKLLRETGAILSEHGARPSGFLTPLGAMAIDHEIGACVVAGGNRRSARMSILPWDDPFIFDFIACKRDPSQHWTTNISVEIDDRFTQHLNQLKGGAPPVGYRDRAQKVLRAVIEGMLTDGEPGLWNSSLSNVGEPREVVCTNPCGEIALMPWENCNLGHVNMDAYARDANNPVRWPDNRGMLQAHRLMTRFLIRATYGDVTDPKQAQVLAENRRIGVGHFGVQGFLTKNGLRFSEAGRSAWFAQTLRMCYQAVRQEARDYAFELRIPEPVKVTTVAPTGSIAKMPGRTEGIHPVYARHFIRRVRFSTVDPDQVATVEELRAQGYRVEPCTYAANTVVVEFPTRESLVDEVTALGLDGVSLVESADEISLRDMLGMQALYQAEYADNAVSFTVNIPEGKYRATEVEEVLTAYLPNLKGTTLMPDGTRPQAPYERISETLFRALADEIGHADVGDSVDEECSNGACPIR